MNLDDDSTTDESLARADDVLDSVESVLDDDPFLRSDHGDDLADTASVSLFEGDEGTLEHGVRHALVALLKQRFVSARTHPRDWRTLVENERVLRSRLNDLFLDLQMDREREVAWKRQAVPETATRALTNATLPYVSAIAGKGWDRAAADDAALAKGLNVRSGRITLDAVARAHGLASA
jgi:hypothetical protein